MLLRTRRRLIVMAAAPGERLPLYPEPLHNFQVAPFPLLFKSGLNQHPDRTRSLTDFTGSPLPRDCVGRAQLQHDHEETRSTKARSHLLGFHLGSTANSLRPRPALHLLPGRPKVPPAAKLSQEGDYLDGSHHQTFECASTREN